MGKNYTKVDSLKKHLRRAHNNCHLDEAFAAAAALENDEDMEHLENNPEHAHIDINEHVANAELPNLPAKKFEYPFAIHILKLREIHRLPRTILDEVSNEYKKLIALNLCDIESAVTKDLASVGLDNQ